MRTALVYAIWLWAWLYHFLRHRQRWQFIISVFVLVHIIVSRKVQKRSTAKRGGSKPHP